MKKYLNLNNIFSIFFFVTLFIIGISIFSHYGISIDEDNSRINGLVSLNYIVELFNIEIFDKLKTLSLPQIHEYSEQGNGVIFDLPLSIIELTLSLDNSREIFLYRHFFTFLIFYISLIFFFLILKKRFNSHLFGILGVLFLFISPRIFAQSFYNSKDIIFMSLNIINLYYGIRYLENSNLKNGIYFSIASGLSVGSRILGIYLPILICIFKIIQILRSNILIKEQFLKLFQIFLLILMFIYIFWPYLWADPIINFYKAFINIGVHQVGIYNFFLGNYIPVEFVPWNYSFIWIAITTPISYIILFLIGIGIFFKRIVNRLFKIDEKSVYNDLWRGDKEKIDILFFLNLVIPLVTIIILHSSIYTGWRHIFFLYPSIIFFTIYSIKIIRIYYIKNLVFFLSLSFLIISPTVLWMYKNHPFQYVYFNSIFKKNFNEYFDADYWGVTNYHALKYILNSNKEKNLFYVGIIGKGDLNISRSFLTSKEKEKIIITEDINKAEYLIDSYSRWDAMKISKNELLNNNQFKNYYDIKINEVPINSIYIRYFK
tara:strand:- start:461 stop:2092 length:1632 start_codon:yes stop_codon:yes gene_type:complete